jgi:hypothetical protein
VAHSGLSAKLLRVLVGLGIVLAAGSARAQVESSPSIPFDLDRHAGAELCPDHDALAAQVEQRLTQSHLPPHAPVADKVTITILRVADDYVANLSIPGSDGQDGGTRSLVDTGKDCAGLAEALSLTLAMIADGRPLFERKPSVVPAPPTPPAPGPQTAPARHRSWELGAGVLGANNLLGAPTVGYGLDAIWHPRPHLAAGVKAAWMPARTIQEAGGRTKVSIEAGLASVCWEILPFDGRFFPGLCGAFGAGVLQGSSEGYVDSQSATRLWLATGAFARAGIGLSKRWSVVAQAGALLTLRSASFTIGGVGSPVYEASRFGGLAEIDLRARIW